MTRYALSTGTPRRRSLLSILLVLLGFAAPLAAQIPDVQSRQPAPQSVAQPTAQPPIIDWQNAESTRQELQQLLRDHPPSVGTVLRSDPSLANETYLASYPALLNFLRQHPEINRNPSYFFGTPDFRSPQQPREPAVEMFNQVTEFFTIILVAGGIIGTLVWLIRFFIDHRRWLRVSRTQAEVHTKLLDRLGNNEELMAYIQTPAGRRFLESAPIALDEKPKSLGAPMSRILWSMQAGVVLASLGIGFFMAQSRFPEDMGEGFYVMGMLVAWLGIGFGVSALLAYIISQRFGLVTPPPRPSPTND